MDEERQLTKKEKRVLRREEKEKERASENRKNFMNKLMMWGGGILVLFVIIFGLFKLSEPPTDSEGNVVKIDAAILDDDRVRGNREAEVVLIEYADFQCPACASFYPIISKLYEEYGDRVAFVFRHFPLRQIHKNAQLASQASEAAGIQGKFWGMHDKLFESQNFWSEESDAESIFEGYGYDMELDIDKYNDDFGSKEVTDKINNDYNNGVASGVNSTPSFFLNGKKLKNIANYEEFRKQIEEELGAS